jgi:hypothetical protein
LAALAATLNPLGAFLNNLGPIPSSKVVRISTVFWKWSPNEAVLRIPDNCFQPLLERRIFSDVQTKVIDKIVLGILKASLENYKGKFKEQLTSTDLDMYLSATSAMDIEELQRSRGYVIDTAISVLPWPFFPNLYFAETGSRHAGLNYDIVRAQVVDPYLKCIQALDLGVLVHSAGYSYEDLWQGLAWLAFPDITPKKTRIFPRGQKQAFAVPIILGGQIQGLVTGASQNLLPTHEDEIACAVRNFGATLGNLHASHRRREYFDYLNKNGVTAGTLANALMYVFSPFAALVVRSRANTISASLRTITSESGNSELDHRKAYWSGYTYDERADKLFAKLEGGSPREVLRHEISIGGEKFTILMKPIVTEEMSVPFVLIHLNSTLHDILTETAMCCRPSTPSPPVPPLLSPIL